MSARVTWTPYRLGVVVALLGLASTAIFLIGLFNILVNGARPPFWPAIPLILIGSAAAWVMNPRYGLRVSALSCSDCGKPVFWLADSDDWAHGMRTGLLWPERECSVCGRDLTGGDGAR